MIHSELLTRELVIELLQKKYALKEKRLKKREKAQKIRKEIYHLSVRINEIESEIDAYIIRKFGRG